MTSKLGVHLQVLPQGWSDFVAEAKPAVVKSLEWGIADEWDPETIDDPEKRAKAQIWKDHKVFLLGRHVVSEQYLENPADQAVYFWQRLMQEKSGNGTLSEDEVLRKMRIFDAWEGYNEVGTGSGPEPRNLGVFDAHLARIFHEHDLKYAGGGFSMTHPTLDEWMRYCEGLLVEVEAGRGEIPDFLHLHEYWWPRIAWENLLNPDGSLDEEAMYEATTGYALNYRKLYESPITPDEMKLPLIISECGWDQAYPEQIGWAESGLPAVAYMQYLRWYDKELQKPIEGKQYVVGATIFTYGHHPRWESFELDKRGPDGLKPIDLLRNYLAAENTEPHAWDWMPKPKEPLAEVSHYVLMAQEISIEWRHALDNYLQTFRVTNGQSHDDALRLAAKEHHITLVGAPDAPMGVPQEVEDYIRRVKPEVLIDRMNVHTAEELKILADMRVERNDRYGAHDIEIVIIPPHTKIGVDCLQPIYDSGTYTSTADADLIAETGAHYVRLNFILPTDESQYSVVSGADERDAPWLHVRFHETGRTWFETYDELIDRFLDRGLKIYGAIGTEATMPRWAPESMRTDTTPTEEVRQWLEHYARSYAAIVEHFCDRVQIFESYNEPNGWHGGNTHILHPHWFGRLLVETYKAVVIDKGIRDVTLVSGPIECPSFPSGMRDQYLADRVYYLRLACQTIANDPEWEPYLFEYGYPFDGIGLHLYLYQNANTSNVIVREGLTAFVDGFTDLIRELEGIEAAQQKKIHVSEIGWMSGDVSCSVAEAMERESNEATYPVRGTLASQNRYLEQALDELSSNRSVGTIIWYGIQDTPEGPWGLYGLGLLDENNRKPSWYTFRRLCRPTV